MAYLHEMIESSSQLPVKMFAFSSNNPKRVIPKHWHLSSELLYCISGSLIIWDESDKYVMHSGDVILVNPNEIHSTQSPDHNHILVIQFPMDFLQKVTSGKYYELFEFDLNTVKSRNSTDDLLVILNRLVALANQYTIIDNLTATANIYALLALLCRNYISQLPIEKRHNNADLTLLGNITGYIQLHFRERLTLPMVAAQFGYSVSYFSKFFAKRMNLTLSEYLQQLRLNTANELLLHSDDTLTNIAYNSGFSSYRNFYNAFLENYQVSPTKYRQQYQHDKILHVEP
ncbi:helix-turn-helix transcriptional regulator [Lactiplantibacillus fabifermentans]|nr:AraC family transcriptional regulator [Lactiplantibacillus fabifermentans]